MGILFSETHELLGGIYPAAFTTEQNTAWIDASKHNRFAVLVRAGNIGTSLDVDIEICTDGAAANLHTLKSMTQLTEAGGDDSSTVIIEIRADELTKPSGTSAINFTHFRVEVTPNGSTIVDVAVFGFDARYEPVPTTLLDEVVK